MLLELLSLGLIEEKVEPVDIHICIELRDSVMEGVPEWLSYEEAERIIKRCVDNSTK